jgi:hypothetical protein
LNRLIRIPTQVLGASFLIVSGAFAQGFQETAFRQSQQGIFGSPKAIGMGGCLMGAGADPSALAFNPAATGLSRKSILQGSLMPFLNTANSTFRNSEVSSEKAGMPFGTIGISLADRRNDGQGFRGGVFTLSYNRTQLTSNVINWEGYTPLFQNGRANKNSIIDYWLDNLNRPDFRPADIIQNPQPVFGDNFKNDVVMAYDAFLLDTADRSFVSAFPESDLDKSGSFSRTMSTGNWNAGYTADFGDRFFIGWSILYHSSTSEASVTYREQIRNVYVDLANPDFNSLQKFRGVQFSINKRLDQTSRGVGANMGILYKLSEAFRLSAAIQLPTITWITERYNPKINYNYNGLNYLGETLGSGEVTWFENEFRYKLRIPARYRAGVTWIAGKAGLLEANVEFTNPGRSRLSDGDNYNFTLDNPQISQNFGTQLNFRTGGEIRYDDFRFRAGFAWIGSGLKNNVTMIQNVPGSQIFLSTGFGARFDLWYWDAGVVSGWYNLKNNFVSGYDQDVETRMNLLQLHLGLGFYL